MNETDYSSFYSIDRTIAHLYYGDIPKLYIREEEGSM